MRSLWLFVAIAILIAEPGNGQDDGQGNGQDNQGSEGQINGNGNQNGEGLTDTDRCEITADPHLRTYHRESSSVPFPCIYHVTKLLVKSDDNTYFTFFGLEVFAASGMITYRGRYYVDYIRINVSAFTGNGVGSRAEVASAVFTITSADVESALAGTITGTAAWTVTMWGTFYDTILYGVNMNTGQAFFSFRHAITSITFRPVNKNEGIPQSPMPGLVIEVGQDLAPENEARFPKTLCSTRNDNRRFKVLAQQAGLKVRQMVLYFAIKQNEAQIHTYCQDLMTTFRDCGSENERKNAIAKCSWYLRHGPASCLESNNAGNAFLAFLYCFKKECGDPSAEASLSNLRAGCFKP